MSYFDYKVENKIRNRFFKTLKKFQVHVPVFVSVEDRINFYQRMKTLIENWLKIPFKSNDEFIECNEMYDDVRYLLEKLGQKN